MRVVQGCHLGISKIIARIFLGRSEYSVWGLIGVPHTITVFYDIHYTVYTCYHATHYTVCIRFMAKREFFFSHFVITATASLLCMLKFGVMSRIL